MELDTGTPAPAGHHEAMVAKVDASAAAAVAATGAGVPAVEAPAPAERPEHIPEKFWDAEKRAVRVDDLAKSYAELEKSRTAAPTPAPTPTGQAEAPKDQAAVAEATASAQAAVGGDALAAFSAEFAEKGQLSEESYKALEQRGIPKAVVDTYIQGQVALRDSYEAQALTTAGGKDQYATMVQWAAKNLTASEIDVYDRSVRSGNPAEMKQAVLGLRARYEATYGTPQGGMVHGTVATGSTGYSSAAEMTRDMKDPRYAQDPAYRAQVERRLSLTTAF